MKTAAPPPDLPGANPEENQQFNREYWCFISYPHANNKVPGRQWASWLQQALETYEVPADLAGTKNERGDVIPERVFPVFRDEEDLSADSELSRPIKRALQQSRFLVVLCSPQAVESAFVADEILRFKQFGKQDRILAAIIEGEPNAGEAGRECFPEPLRFTVDESGQLTRERTEPIAADFRLPDGTVGWTSPAAYREVLEAADVVEREIVGRLADHTRQQNLMFLKIVAGVLGVPLGVLTQRDKVWQLARQKQRARVLRRWLAGVSVLGLTAAVAGWMAYRNEQRAVTARGEAVTQRDRALSTLALSYHDRALALAKEDWQQAMTYAAGALRLQPDSRLHGSLAFSLLSRHMGEVPLAVPLDGERCIKMVFDPAGARVMACRSDGPPAVIDLATGARQVAALPVGSLGVCMGGSFSADGGTLMVDGREAFRWLPGADVIAAPAKGMLVWAQIPAWDGGRFTAARVEPKLANMVAGGGSKLLNTVQLLDMETGVRSEFTEHQGAVVAVFSLPGERFLTIGKDKRLMVLDAKAGTQVPVGEALPRIPKLAAASSTGQMVAAVHGAERTLAVSLIETTGDFKQRTLSGLRADVAVKSMAFSPSGEHLAIGFSGPDAHGQLRVWHVATGEPVSPWVEFDDWVEEVAFDPAGERVAGVCDEGLLFHCDLGGRVLGKWKVGKDGNGVTFSAGGMKLAVATGESVVQVFDPRQPSRTVRQRRMPQAVSEIVPIPGADAVCLLGENGKQHQLWSVTGQEPLGKSVAHADPVVSARGFVSGGRAHVVLVLKSGAIEVWDGDGARVAERAGDPAVTELGNVPKAIMEDPAVKVWYCGLMAGAAADIQSSPGRVAVARWAFNLARFREIVAEAEKAGGSADQFTRLMWDPKGGIMRGEILLLDERTLETTGQVPLDINSVSCRLSADGKTIAALSGADAHLGVLRQRGGSPEWSYFDAPVISKTGMSVIVDYTVSPDGRQLGAAGGFGAALLDVDATKPEWRVFAEGARVAKVRFSPDSRRVALDVSPNDHNGAAQIWDTATAAPLSPLLEHADSLGGLAFTPDSSLLATWSEDGILNLWDSSTGRAAMPLAEIGFEINSAAFVGDGSALMFADTDRMLWSLAVPPARAAPGWVPAFLEGLGCGRLDASGKFLAVPLSQAVDQRAILRDVDPAGLRSWHDLARCLANAPDARIPGLAATQSAEEFHDIERRFKDGDHTTAYMKLREFLRAHPDASPPESLSQLARFVRHRGDRIFVDEDAKGPHAGDTMEGPAGLRFRWCPPGTFIMGSPASENGRRDNETPHRVVLTRGFWMAETEVTQAQWERVMETTALDHAKKRLAEPATFPFGKNQTLVTALQWHNLAKPEDLDAWTSWFGPDKPMMCVTHSDAVEFATRVSILMPPARVLGYWTGGGACRLPTEAEWEYACRAGTRTATYVGDNDPMGKNHSPKLSPIAWYSGNATQGVSGPGWNSAKWSEMELPGPVAANHSVGTKMPNPWGIHDMLGNVKEWCLDHYRQEQVDGEVNPYVGFREGNRVIRGQAIESPASSHRAAFRASDPPAWRSVLMGFRILLVEHEAVESPEP